MKAYQTPRAWRVQSLVVVGTGLLTDEELEAIAGDGVHLSPQSRYKPINGSVCYLLASGGLPPGDVARAWAVLTLWLTNHGAVYSLADWRAGKAAGKAEDLRPIPVDFPEWQMAAMAAAKIVADDVAWPASPDVERPQRDLVLETAEKITASDRQGDYGHPLDHFSRTVGFLNVFLGPKLKEPLTPQDWPLMMVLDKLARHMNKAKVDNLVDVVGYTLTLAMVNDRLKEGSS